MKHLVTRLYFEDEESNAEDPVLALVTDPARRATLLAARTGDGYRFDIRLPNYFAGRPLSHGAARVLIEATVKDSASHAETRGEPITVSDSPILLTAIPEGGTLVPHLENQVFILASYPDGSPAKMRSTASLSPVSHCEPSGNCRWRAVFPTRGEGRTSAMGKLKSIPSPITRRRPDGSAHIRTSRCCEVFPS